MFRRGLEEIDSWTVYDRFMASADDAGVDREFAASILADAIAGDTCSRELVEATCDVEFSDE